MKTLAYCFSCDKEHDITRTRVDKKEFKCECGGYVISPSGKINMKLIPENDEDRKLLGLEIEKITPEVTEKPMPKVFKMDECSWVCAMDEESAIAWYINTTGAIEEDLDIKECDINKVTMYSETSISNIVKKLVQINDYDVTSFSISKKYGGYFIRETFREVIEDMIEQSGYESVIGEPFEICSTEW